MEKHNKVIIKAIKLIPFALLVFYFLIDICIASDVLFVDNFKTSSTAFQQLKVVCKFYGINLKRLSLSNSAFKSSLKMAMRDKNIGAIVFEAEVLGYTDADEVFGDMQVPCLVVNVRSDIDSVTLKRCSKNAVIGCTSVDDKMTTGFYRATELKDFTFELANQLLPFEEKAIEKIYSLELDKEYKSQILLEVCDDKLENCSPAFVRTAFPEKQIFFLSAIELKTPFEIGTESLEKRFFQLAPLMFFIRYSFGDKCFHPPGYYANFSIDDPFLIEPYGNLNYEKLLWEMENSNFHTTIAFIPWNFDRSESEVVELFHKNLKRYSVSIHGNNHDHKEFSIDRSLYEQEDDIKQAIGRMEKFSTLTGLPYDRVMVFPHGIGSTGSLKILKKYNFLSTVNADNIPLGSERNSDADEINALRSYTVAYENFPSLKRYSVMTSQNNIAIRLFLNGMILLYTHQDFLKNGMHQIRESVRNVNKIIPDIEWRSFGHISHKLYLQKYGSEGECYIESFSSNILIENRFNREVTYFISKEKSLDPAIKMLLINGQNHSYYLEGNNIHFETTISANSSSHVVIIYENDLNLESIETSKVDSYIGLLRKISDYRDIVMSRSQIGIELIRIYYKYGAFNLILFILLTCLFCIGALIAIYVHVQTRKRKTADNKQF